MNLLSCQFVIKHLFFLLCLSSARLHCVWRGEDDRTLLLGGRFECVFRLLHPVDEQQTMVIKRCWVWVFTNSSTLIVIVDFDSSHNTQHSVWAAPHTFTFSFSTPSTLSVCIFTLSTNNSVKLIYYIFAWNTWKSLWLGDGWVRDCKQAQQ